MSYKTRVSIVGYGNLAKGVEYALENMSDMELVSIFTRRDPISVHARSKVPVYHIDDVLTMRDQIDVIILCGGSATDLPSQTPYLASMFNVVDSFDTHAKIPEHFDAVNRNSLKGNKVSIISAGWDPGVFSLNRIYAQSILPRGKTYTFWGKGVSQGHSDAIRRIEGVKNAIQYTVPVKDAVDEVRRGTNPSLGTGEKHTRECFVVAQDGADLKEIERQIKTMPNYFDEYKTTVRFISEEELLENHSKMAHGGFVIHSGKTGQGNNHIIEYSLKLDSNPEFTASILVCYARAAAKLCKSGQFGAKTVFDIAPALLSEKDGDTLRRELL